MYAHFNRNFHFSSLKETCQRFLNKSKRNSPVNTANSMASDSNIDMTGPIEDNVAQKRKPEGNSLDGGVKRLKMEHSPSDVNDG